jgi:hypothetical protein
MNYLAFYLVVDADCCGLGDVAMTINGFLDLASPDTAARDINHVVGS